MSMIENALRTLADTIIRLKPISDRADDIKLVADAITTTYEKSDKIGYKWEVKKFGEQLLSKTYVVDEDYVATDEDGTYLKPYIYSDGMEVTEGFYYKFPTHDDNIWVCIKSGVAEYTSEWFEIIE